MKFSVWKKFYDRTFALQRGISVGYFMFLQAAVSAIKVQRSPDTVIYIPAGAAGSLHTGIKGDADMKMTEKMTVWGVRGSFPMTGADYAEYGGNTCCISIDFGETAVILDAGSGLARLGRELERQHRKRADILITHVHMDHCLGLFGFRLFHDPEAEIHLYGTAHDGIPFHQCLHTLAGPPYWPLGLNDFPARVLIHEVCPGDTFRLSGMENMPQVPAVQTLAGNHPNQSLFYRLEWSGKSILYALDCELDDCLRSSLTEFARNTDLLIWDASFTEEDLLRRKGWGHSAWKEGAALGRAAGAGRVLMTHYAADYADDFLRKQEETAAMQDSIILFAKEGMELSL